MIPILYDKNETSFTSNGLGRLRDIISCIVTEERNGIYECDFEYPVNGANYDLIQIGRTIAVTHDDTGDVQPFDIIGFEKPIDGIVTFHAVHISYRQRFITVAPAANSYTSTMAAFSDFVDNSEPENPFTYTDPMLTGHIAAADGLPHTIREMLGGIEGSILDTFGGEYKWDKFNVALMESRGVVRDITVRYGVNMIEYTDTADSSESYSSCVPYWTDGTNTVIGDRTDSTGGTTSGRIECVPLDLSDKFESQPTKAQLTNAAKKYMSANSTYLTDQSIVVSFIPLNRYDTVSPEPPAPSTFTTVLYDDGTLIINEDSNDRTANIAKHGPVRKEYPSLDDDNDYVMTSEDDQPWHDEANDIERVEKGSDVKAKSTAYWYKGLTNVKVIDVSWLDTSDVTNMTGMFQGCSNLETIIVSDKFVVSQVTSSNDMFTGDTKLRGGAGSPYNSSYRNKTYARIDTGIAYDPGYFTYGVDELTILKSDGTLIINAVKSDISGSVSYRYNAFDSNIFPYVFGSASGGRPWMNEAGLVTAVRFGSTVNPTKMDYWFHSFDNCTSYNFTNLVSSGVTSMIQMFQNIKGPSKTLDLSALDTSAVTRMDTMFNLSSSFTSINVSGFNTTNVTRMNGMFADCTGLTTLNLRNFKTPALTRCADMFSGDTNLQTILASNDFDVSNVSNSNSQDMFKNCTSLIGGMGTVYDSNYTNKLRAKIDGGFGDEGYFTA